jgi:hypothetical protein
MEIRVTVSDGAARAAAEKAIAVGVTLELAVAAYVLRIADGTEPLENDLFTDGTPKQRTLRQQIYRL